MKEIPLFKVFMPKGAEQAVIKTLRSGYLAEGARVKEFRNLVADFIGNPYVVPVSSCTMALHIAYRLAGVGPGDEVISTLLTCIATNTPLLELGAKIVWADCEPKTGMVDPKKLEALITKKTKAIVVLHKDGDLARMDEILAVAKKHNIKVVEDAAHTFGAKYKDRMIGTVGDYTCFSFQAIKHITTGDGGVIACKNEKDYNLAKKIKWLGLDKDTIVPGSNPWLNDISTLGYKGNMNDLSATLGIAGMKHIKDIVKKFNRNGNLYNKLLSEVPGIELVDRESGNMPIYWTYVILTEKRDKLMTALKSAGVASMIVHPRNDNYSIFAKSKRKLPGVDYYSSRELSLPCGWWVEKEDIKNIVDIIKKNI